MDLQLCFPAVTPFLAPAARSKHLGSQPCAAQQCELQSVVRMRSIRAGENLSPSTSFTPWIWRGEGVKLVLNKQSHKTDQKVEDLHAKRRDYVQPVDAVWMRCGSD